jgi:hypothetical protein
MSASLNEARGAIGACLPTDNAPAFSCPRALDRITTQSYLGSEIRRRARGAAELSGDGGSELVRVIDRIESISINTPGRARTFVSIRT